MANYDINIISLGNVTTSINGINDNCFKKLLKKSRKNSGFVSLTSDNKKVYINTANIITVTETLQKDYDLRD